MNIHKNARLTYRPSTRNGSRRCSSAELTLAASRRSHGVSVPTVRKWVGRFLAQGEAGLRDARRGRRSSRLGRSLPRRAWRSSSCGAAT